jgi:hypothetical protein
MSGASIRFGLFAATAAALAVSGLALRSTDTIPSRTREAWKTGFWIWAGDAPVHAEFTPEILYVEAPGRHWPDNLPDAEQYVVVQRLEPATPLTHATASAIVEHHRTLLASSGAGVRIAGLQIDYDSPTSSLTTYGTFLRELRQELPADQLLSITVLLDWFGPRTAIAGALKWVDEFVPQFYDTVHERLSAGIAEPIDASTWAPVFNAYRIPYRIGISSFGRIARRRLDGSGRSTVHYFRDASPMDFAGRRQFVRSVRATSAGELVVHYDVAPIDGSIEAQPELQPRDVVEITFPTEASVRTASRTARQFGGYCAGIVAFRWPGRSETMTLPPDEVRRVVSGEPLLTDVNLEVRPAACLERVCSDLYLDLGGVVSAADRSIGIRAGGPMEIFVPGGPLRPGPVRRGQIPVRVPAYSGIGHVYVGRAVSSGPVHFEVVQP